MAREVYMTGRGLVFTQILNGESAMKGFKKNLLAIGLAAAGLAGWAQGASAITVDGVTFNEGPVFVFAGGIFEQAPTTVGQSLNGYGTVSLIDGAASFCAGCELTFVFSGYTVTNTASVDANPLPDFAFSGGTVTFYVDTTPNFNANTGISTAQDGNVWLTLAGDAYTNQFGLTGSLISMNTDISSTLVPNFGLGFFDVTGGPAAPFLNTSLILSAPNYTIADGNADFSFTSSFQRPIASSDPNYPIQGTGELQGNSQVPEPASLALLGLGLLGLAARRSKS